MLFGGFMNLKEYLTNSPRGEAARIARAINDSKSNVSLWKDGKKSIPASKCKAIVAATNGQVTLKELKPKDWQKFWPELVE